MPGILLAGAHFSEQISVMSGYAVWKQPSGNDGLCKILEKNVCTSLSEQSALARGLRSGEKAAWFGCHLPEN